MTHIRMDLKGSNIQQCVKSYLEQPLFFFFHTQKNLINANSEIQQDKDHLGAQKVAADDENIQEHLQETKIAQAKQTQIYIRISSQAPPDLNVQILARGHCELAIDDPVQAEEFAGPRTY